MSRKRNQTTSVLYNEAHRLSFWQTTVCTRTVLCGSLGCLTVCGVFAQRTGSLLSLCIWQEQTNIQSVILSLLSSLQARQMYTRIHIFPPAAVTQQKTHQFNFFLGGGGQGPRFGWKAQSWWKGIRNQKGIFLAKEIQGTGWRLS